LATKKFRAFQLKVKTMKKMTMMIMALFVAGMTQAAAVTWNTGKLYTPTPGTGVFGGEVNATSSEYLATVYFFVDNAGVAGAAITGLSGITDDTTVALSDALNGTTSGYDFTAGSTYWAQVVITSLPASGTYYTMTSDVVSFTIPGTGNGSINFTTAGAMPSQWTVVPEPTSMALLALGVVAASLRRRFYK
jgi:hypothetical protein